METSEEKRPRCQYCNAEIDTKVCWCGDYIEGHSMYDGYTPVHTPVMTGCICTYETEGKDMNNLTENSIMIHRKQFQRRIDTSKETFNEIKDSFQDVLDGTEKLEDILASANLHLSTLHGYNIYEDTDFKTTLKRIAKKFQLFKENTSDMIEDVFSISKLIKSIELDASGEKKEEVLLDDVFNEIENIMTDCDDGEHDRDEALEVVNKIILAAVKERDKILKGE